MTPEGTHIRRPDGRELKVAEACIQSFSGMTDCFSDSAFAEMMGAFLVFALWETRSAYETNTESDFGAASFTRSIVRA